MKYISTFDPPTMVALLNEIERLRRERDAALDVLGREDIGDVSVIVTKLWAAEAAPFLSSEPHSPLNTQPRRLVASQLQPGLKRPYG